MCCTHLTHLFPARLSCTVDKGARDLNSKTTSQTRLHIGHTKSQAHGRHSASQHPWDASSGAPPTAASNTDPDQARALTKSPVLWHALVLHRKGPADHRGPLQCRVTFSCVKHVLGPSDHRGALECLSLLTASPYSILASHRVFDTHAVLDTFSLTHYWQGAIVPVDVIQQGLTALSLHITCMIHSIQVTIYTSARVLCSGVTRFLSLPPHITQCYDTATNPPLVL